MTRLSLALFVFDDAIDPTRLCAALSPAERARHARLPSARRRREYLASRWLLRQHLACIHPAAPRALSIEYPPGAPPRSADTPSHLGLSHSGVACLSLVADGVAGCDIEQVRRRRFAPERYARHCFHPDETAALSMAAPGQRIADFHRLWTLKEASLKARGLGLGSGMARPSFALRPRLACTRPPADGAWSFGACDLQLPAGRFALALAAAAPEITLVLARLRPGRAAVVERELLSPDWQIIRSDAH
ncbi:4'-phosphopantetheinyl transferase family protein [Salinisphaera sp. RV14]|uniref:4'-phosphopantetheinyl transferase family protein n=1 Tax=Salinisphaera sp. RV14 TaxID=3454140 RepID=UPI003F84B80D